MADQDLPAPSVDAAGFAVLTRRAGLDLDEAQRAVLHEVWGAMEAMFERNRGPERPRAAEPAHIFVPNEAWGPRT